MYLGREFTETERLEIHGGLLRAKRHAFLETGVAHPNFQELFQLITTPTQRERVQAALGPYPAGVFPRLEHVRAQVLQAGSHRGGMAPMPTPSILWGPGCPPLLGNERQFRAQGLHVVGEGLGRLGGRRPGTEAGRCPRAWSAHSGRSVVFHRTRKVPPSKESKMKAIYAGRRVEVSDSLRQSAQDGLDKMQA